jgi:hypothetical protein
MFRLQFTNHSYMKIKCSRRYSGEVSGKHNKQTGDLHTSDSRPTLRTAKCSRLRWAEYRKTK